LPYRVDVEKNWKGEDQEIAKVLDLATGTWRRASHTEVEQSRTDSAGLAA
jgi:hypothetical protein